MAASASAEIGEWNDDSLFEAFKWYHGTMTRHVAEALLLSNGIEGTYLLRRSPTNPTCFAVSVKTHQAVLHYQVVPEVRNAEVVHIFGQRSFATLAEFRVHFEKVPALSGDACILTPLKFPYRRDFADADHAYRQVTRIRMLKETAPKRGREAKGTEDQTDAMTPFLGSREGFLFKVGSVRKSIRERWFVMCRMKLAYYKTRDSDRPPIRVLDLLKCSKVECLENQQRPNCFVLMFAKRKFILFAPSAIERETWFNLIQWKLEQRNIALRQGADLDQERDALEEAFRMEQTRSGANSDNSESDDDVGMDELPVSSHFK